jgi:hypothetical protein
MAVVSRLCTPRTQFDELLMHCSSDRFSDGRSKDDVYGSRELDLPNDPHIEVDEANPWCTRRRARVDVQERRDSPAVEA